MKRLYIDCRNGVSGDMVPAALAGLGADLSAVKNLKISYNAGESHVHTHGETHDYGRSFEDVKRIIGSLPIEYTEKRTAIAIYTQIAKAEASVHGATLETVHFHEVGRDRAILNIVGVAVALAQLKGQEEMEIFCSEIHDGYGFVDCAHGRIPVPVPAVRALMETCDYTFCQDDVPTEMVTPTGLAMLLGMGARYVPDFDERLTAETAAVSARGECVRGSVGKGGRDTGREGLIMHIFG